MWKIIPLLLLVGACQTTNDPNAWAASQNMTNFGLQLMRMSQPRSIYTAPIRQPLTCNSWAGGTFTCY